MSELHTIQVVAYWGDRETYNDLHIIGPYPTAIDRNRDIYRLERLKGAYGDAEFLPSNRPPSDAYMSATPEQVATATHIDHVVGALYNMDLSRDPRDEPDDVQQGYDEPTLFDLTANTEAAA